MIPYSNTRPPSPRTGYTLPKCYASALADCDQKLSGEHWISENVLLQLGTTLLVTSKKLGGAKKLTPANLDAKILCARHNTALSPLDACAGTVFRAICEVGSCLDKDGGRVDVNGHDFEKMLLKTMCGFLAVEKEDIPEPWVRILFAEADLAQPRGLQLNVRIGDTLPASNDSIVYETVRDKSDKPIGCALTLRGFRFILSMNVERLFDLGDLNKQSIVRPRHVRWTHATTGAQFVLGFTFYPGGSDGLS
ncbi:MAG: hypothetical protein ACREJX_06545, partial [Polyangiaceae bacterium]